MSEKALQPIEHKAVNFYGDELDAVQTDGEIYASVRSVCEALGIDHRAQFRRIRRSPVLERGFKVVKMTTLKGLRDTNVLRVDLLPMFLAGIGTKSIKDDAIRGKLEKYQDEVAKVLWDAFGRGQLVTAPDAELEEVLANDPDLREAYSMARAVISLIHSQAKLQTTVGDHERRLQIIEADQGDRTRFVTQEQATDISQAVKTLAFEMSKDKSRKGSAFQSVYGELYRRFKVPSYKEIPAVKYNEVMNFLRQWYQSIIGSDEIPF